jgi:hypothetical protein
MNALTAVVLLVFSLALIAIGLVATARLRRSGRVRPPLSDSAPSPTGQPQVRARSAQPPAPAPIPKGAPMPPGAPEAPGAADYADEGWAGQPYSPYPGGQSETLYPGGMDAEAAEIERLKAEVAALKAHSGDGSGFKRTQAVVAVAANVSGILGLLVSLAALVK